MDPAGKKYAYYDGGLAICLNGNALYTAGVLRNNGEDSSGFALTSGGGTIYHVPFYESEMFLMKYDTAGNLHRIIHSGQNAGGHVTPSDLYVDSSQNIFIGGTIDNWNGGNGTKKLFGAPLVHDNTDIFFAKLNPDFCTTDSFPRPMPVRISPYAGRSTLGTSTAGGTLSWSSRPAGLVSEDLHPKVAPDSSTVYYLTVISNGGSVESDSVLVTVNTPKADAGKDALVCNGVFDTIGMADLGDQYSWTSNPTGFLSNSSRPSVSPEQCLHHLFSNGKKHTGMYQL